MPARRGNDGVNGGSGERSSAKISTLAIKSTTCWPSSCYHRRDGEEIGRDGPNFLTCREVKETFPTLIAREEGANRCTTGINVLHMLERWRQEKDKTTLEL